MREIEKEIGGQIELVRIQADIVHRRMERLSMLVMPLDPETLSTTARGLRNCADEIETLGGMLNEYTWIQKENAKTDPQRAAVL